MLFKGGVNDVAFITVHGEPLQSVYHYLRKLPVITLNADPERRDALEKLMTYILYNIPTSSLNEHISGQRILACGGLRYGLSKVK